MAGKCTPLPSGPIHSPPPLCTRGSLLAPHPPSEGGIVFGGGFLLLSKFDQRVDVTVTPMVQTSQLLFVKHGTFPDLEAMIGMGKSQEASPPPRGRASCPRSRTSSHVPAQNSPVPPVEIRRGTLDATPTAQRKGSEDADHSHTQRCICSTFWPHRG